MSILPDSAAKMYLKRKELNHNELNYEEDKTSNYFPSVVMIACVTMAPRALYANLSINLPVSMCHTPTQPRVTVTATPIAWHKL